MRTRAVEWPTVAVAVAIAAGLAAVLTWNTALPVLVQLGALAVLGAWYNSLQHEVVHGHPTPWRAVNTALAIVPLGLVTSFPAYRAAHIAHHAVGELTDPAEDPESFYVSAATWQRCGPIRRALLVALRTLAGRMVLGPPLLAGRDAVASVRRSRSVRGAAGAVAHLAAVAGVLAVVWASGMSVVVYVVGVAWGGGALTLLRSFAEHRYVDGATRSAVVRSGPLLSLLFLNNNLHFTHHARPGIAWYGLPAAHDRLGSDLVAARGAGVHRSYAALTRRYLLHPFDSPVYPGTSPPP